MGRKKIQISRITDERNRQVTFNKRKFGVMKKAYELSVLCDCEIALIIFSSNNKLYQYASTDMDRVLLKYTEYNEPHESLTNKNIIEALNKKEHKNGACSPDSPENDSEYQLTPRTEAKYNKIDEEFQIMMQKSQITTNRVNQSSYSHTLPTSLPVAYSDSSSLLQSSPHMGQTSSLSPRPSSSDADSVYPSGSMLEISNGYPHSSSPIGGSPSPGPPPVHLSKPPPPPPPKLVSPNNPSNRNSLRVVIPNAHEDNTGVPASTLNTPVVSLQTPVLSSYPGLFSDISTSDMTLSSALSWTSSIAHTSGLSHLGVGNNSPPSTSTTSPRPAVRIKTEPVSPTRDHPLSHLSHPLTSHLINTTSNSNCANSNININTNEQRVDYEGVPPSKRQRDNWST